MRDVSTKTNTLRTARAEATLHVSPSTIRAIKSGKLPKADPLVIARVAAIQAAKQTSVLIPYCHQVPLDFVSVDFVLRNNSIIVSAYVKAIWKTGVEMEALSAASAAALTLYDMLKIIDERMEIGSVKLLEKTGGKSAMKLTGKGFTAAVIVLSDRVSKGIAEDRSGKVLVQRLKDLKFTIKKYLVLPDERSLLEKTLIELSDKQKTDLILTTGGTGAGPRDCTPEATLDVIDRRLGGVEDMLHSYGNERKRTAMFTRGVAGLRGNTLIVNLPGAVSAVEDGMNALFPAIIHIYLMLQGEGHEPHRKKRT